MSMKKIKRMAGLTVLNLIFIIICLLALIPILYAVSLSFCNGGSGLSSDLSFWPKDPTWKNYSAILVEEPFLLWLKNSVILSVGTMIAAMGTAVTAAYAFSRYRFKGRNGVLQALLILNAFPQILSMFAIFRLFKTFHLLNSYLGLVIVYAGSMCIFSIWNMKGYFDTIPVEIEEAARIDGANKMQTFVQVVLPLVAPGVVATAIYTFINTWNEFLYALILMNNTSKMTVAVALRSLDGAEILDWGDMMAASALVVLPSVIFFCLIQNKIAGGMADGAVKS